MIFEALQARYGDCLFITYADGALSRRILIDGGPAGVYRQSLAPRLKAERTGLPPSEALVIDGIMVSHIDEDHILGILDLFSELQTQKQRSAPLPYRPTWLFHNSLDSLAGEGDGGLARGAGGETVLASVGDEIMSIVNGDPIAAEVLQSYSQGSKLSRLAAALSVASNPPDKKVLMLDPGNPRILRIGEASFTIVGPLEEDVTQLRTKWSEWKAKQEEKAVLADYLDKSVPNLSSIVALLQYRNRKVLLTGDARGDKVLEGLKGAQLWNGVGAFDVDILKVPHHGSERNLKLDFFQKIKADHYVISGDGTYGNPDRKTLEMIAEARPLDSFTVHLTYTAEHCDITHDQWRQVRGKPPFRQGIDSISDVVSAWRAGGRITVQEGPVSIPL